MFEDTKIKKSIVITLILLSLFLLAKFVAEVKALRFIGSNPSGQSIISVSGKGEVVKIPDLATFSFSITEESLVVKTAQENAAEKMNAILKYLKVQGVVEKDVKTSGYSIYPRYEQARDPRCRGPKDDSFTQSLECVSVPYKGVRTLVGYVVSQTVSIKVRNLGDAGKLLSGIGELGATDVSGLSFDFDKRDELLREARDKAIRDAREEAARLAKALGVRLVRIISYNEGGGFPIYARAETFGIGGDTAVPKSLPEIPVGEGKIVSTVTITYEVK